MPNTSVPPDAATEMLMSRSRPTSVANADASAQSASHDMLELENTRDWTVIGCSLIDAMITERITAIRHAKRLLMQA